jgi:hypothetical protein
MWFFPVSHHYTGLDVPARLRLSNQTHGLPWNRGGRDVNIGNLRIPTRTLPILRNATLVFALRRSDRNAPVGIYSAGETVFLHFGDL